MVEIQVLTNGTYFLMHFSLFESLSLIYNNIQQYIIIYTQYSKAHTFYTLIDLLPEFSGFISSGLSSIEYVCIWGNRNDFCFVFVFFFVYRV